MAIHRLNHNWTLVFEARPDVTLVQMQPHKFWWPLTKGRLSTSARIFWSETTLSAEELSILSNNDGVLLDSLYAINVQASRALYARKASTAPTDIYTYLVYL